ncbi:TPA: GntR family transcriptional regulator [Candidatus Ventrenecus avicola]|nr:GntR family transcriptional regulator [Candidatus Ventrenecus avicola]
MNIIITNSNDTPIFMQIKDSIKESIFLDTLKEGESLPSVRAFASDLKISFLTVKRAYDELEKEGFIKTIPGKGSFISPKNMELIREEKLKQIESYIEEIYKLSKISNITEEEIKELFQFIFEEEQK